MNSKVELRKQFRSLRISVMNKDSKAVDALKNLTSLPEWKNAKQVLLYSSIGAELATSPLFARDITVNKKVLLPVTLNLNGEMGVGLWSSQLPKGNFNIPEPTPIENYDISQIDIILIPGIAFDKSGGRLGQGKGFYDRFLAQTNSLRMGYCFEAQLTQNIPMDPHDLFMDYIITESRCIKCSG